MSKAKKKYESPNVTIVQLNPNQAVLSVCSTLTTNVRATGTGTRCRSNCNKKGSSTTGDSKGRS